MPEPPPFTGERAPSALSALPAWILPTAFGLAAVAAQLPIFDRNFVSMDEGHLALAASRLLDGDLLYRDIHTGIFPGIYASAAALFALFGEDLIVTRVAQMLVNAASVVLLFKIGVRIMSAGWALLPPALFIALIWIAFPVLSMFNYSALAGALALGSLLATLRWVREGRRADAIAVGVGVGLCLFTKQNYGGLAAIAITLGVSLVRARSGLQGQSWLAAFTPVIASGSVLIVVALGALTASGTLGPWLDSTLLSLIGSQLEDFNNPIPPILGAHPDGDIRFIYLYIPSSFFDFLVRGDRFLGMPIDAALISMSIRLFYGLPLAALIAAPVLLALLPEASFGSVPRGADDEALGESDATAWNAALLVVTFAIVFFFGIFPSCVFSHLVYVLAPVLLLFAWLGSRLAGWLETRMAGAARVTQAAASLLVVCMVGACATIPGHIRRTYSTEPVFPHASLYVSSDQAILHREALRFLEECTTPGEPIFTLPIVPILYLASDHPNPVKWDLLIPGAIDEEKIVETLERRRVRCIVRQRDMNPEFRPLHRLYPTLDGYIKKNYQRGRELRGGPSVWFGLRRSSPFEGNVP